MTVHFIGAGPGAPDLLTLRGRDLIAASPVCLYAGSLVPEAILAHCPPGARIVNTAPMSLDQILEEMRSAHAAGHDIARLHSGDLSVWSAMGEQLRGLREAGIAFTVTPGVPSFAAAAAAIEAELTLPGLCQSVVLTRTSGRASSMPESESLQNFAKTGAVLAIHLSIHVLARVVDELTPHYGADCPVAVVWRASWPDERVVRATLATVQGAVGDGMERTALILVGRTLGAQDFDASRLYAGDYDRRYRPVGTAAALSGRQRDMIELSLVGIGTGNPDHLTRQGIAALNAADIILLPRKGADKADLAEVRASICAQVITNPATRIVAFDMPVRDDDADYAAAVNRWHDAIAQIWLQNIREHLPYGGRLALLVWGDPSLYDSTLRIAERLATHLVLRVSVVPGITALQALTAAHAIALNEINAPVLITTGRRLRDHGWPPGADTVAVMLDGHCAFQHLDPAGIAIWWGAFLGMPQQLCISGPLAETGPKILEARPAARAAHGWIMDTYLLRRSASTPTA